MMNKMKQIKWISMLLVFLMDRITYSTSTITSSTVHSIGHVLGATTRGGIAETKKKAASSGSITTTTSSSRRRGLIESSTTITTTTTQEEIMIYPHNLNKEVNNKYIIMQPQQQPQTIAVRQGRIRSRQQRRVQQSSLSSHHPRQLQANLSPEEMSFLAGILFVVVVIFLFLCCCCCRPIRCSLWDCVALACLWEICCDPRQDDVGSFMLI